MLKHYHIQVKGIVQGVGFRPFIYNLAARYNLNGSVANDTEGVDIHFEGDESSILQCVDMIQSNPPPLARIIDMKISILPSDGFKDFTIVASRTTSRRDVFIPPDTSICNECLHEFFDSGNRRYHYPFITCTHCGPRFSIIGDIPYDRCTTSMNQFSLCNACAAEYAMPADRRFHTQPNACPVCGPHVTLCDSSSKIIETRFDAVINTVQGLLKNHIVALKSVGGYHLACDATNDACVKLLRERKHRPFKPFAIMVSSIEFLETFCQVTHKEKELLSSDERPIVLVKLAKNILSRFVAPGLTYIGVMLPNTPFQHILFSNNPDSIYVMTSANVSDEPIIYEDDDAFGQLHTIADYIAVYNREIISHTDDSVVYAVDENAFFMRRSRGYVPAPLFIKPTHVHILATGGDLKNSFALARDNFAVMSQYLGDLSAPRGNDLYRRTIAHFCKIFDVKPALIAHDLHPHYFTTLYAQELEERGIRTTAVQHHHAHIASVCEEHGIYGDVIGIAYDGTGYGTDNTLWGSELLIANSSDFLRQAHFEYFCLPGGEQAIKDPWKIGLSLLAAGGISDKDFFAAFPEKEYVKEIIDKNINCPLTCSIGRIFDGVAALLGIAHRISTEAEAAMLLEEAAFKAFNDTSSFALPLQQGVPSIIPTRHLIREIINMIEMEIPVPVIAMRFHRAVADATIHAALHLRDNFKINTAALSGGVFHNRILLHLITEGLRKNLFDIYHPQKLPCNDGGIALGQIAISRNRYVRH